MPRRDDLAAFLRSRRAALTPAAAGVPAGERARRVPGLRREELARLAGVSVDYYVRLEQGRDIQPSPGVLDALAGALQLDEAEREYLHTCAAAPPVVRRRSRPERVRPVVAQLVASLDPAPALVIGRRLDVLTMNRAAVALLGDLRGRNLVEFTLLDEAARSIYAEWDVVVADTIGALRLAAARHPDDPRMATLIGELSIRSEAFRRGWATQRVREKGHGVKRFARPLVGPLELAYETLVMPGDGDQRVVTYLAEAGSPSATALHLLTTLTEVPHA